MAHTHGNGYAEEVVVPAAAVVLIPTAMDFVTAAAFPVAYGTSHWALALRGGLQSGETLLVLGAAGGGGGDAVGIRKGLRAGGIAGAGRPEKLGIAREHGGRELVRYSRGSARDGGRELTGG